MKKALSSAEAHPMASMLDARSINWFSAALVREMAKESTPSEFEEAFGATPEHAEEILAQWELCAMPYWGAEELAGVIVAADPTRSPRIVVRSIEMAQKAGEVPEAFKPAEGIQWAMARGFAMVSTVATLVGVEPGVYGGSQPWPPSARLELAPPREELSTPAAKVQNWQPHWPERDGGLSIPLYKMLAKFKATNSPRPTARIVMDAWRESIELPISAVLADSVEYFDGHGNIKSENIKGLTARILRMTKPRL